MITFQTETVDDVKEEIQSLLREHYVEIAKYKDSIPLAPDWGRYLHLEAEGALAVFTARASEEGGPSKLVGYAVFFLTYHIHYRHTLFATNDVLFLQRGHRTGTTGIKLIKYSEQQLRERDVQRLLWHVKTDNDFSPILHRLGYQTEEMIVGKLLKK